MATGIVKWFKLQKGFGFIKPDEGDADAFVHADAVARAGLFDLREGQKVAFDLITNKITGKTTAENLKLV